MPKISKKSRDSRCNNQENENKTYLGLDRTGKIGKHHISFKINHKSNNVTYRSALTNLDDNIMTSNNTKQVLINHNNKRQTYRGKKNSSMPLLLPESDWYRIEIPYGYKYEKDLIINTLSNYMAEIFRPIMYKIVGTDAVFYVDDQRIANRLLNCNRKIKMIDGFKLIIKVILESEIEQYNIDNEVKERLKRVVIKRYVPETNALNLFKFHLDPELQDYFCALCYPAMMITVLDIVTEHVPNLRALNLEGNKLRNIDLLYLLTKKFVHLKILHISYNKIDDIRQLNILKYFNLHQLRLTGNPVCKNYEFRQNEYISDVRRRLPKLLRLDDIELPQSIDIVEDICVQSEQLNINE